MPEVVAINRSLGLIEVRSYGKVKPKDNKASVAAVGAIYEEFGVSDVLIDTREQIAVPPQIDVFEMISALPLKAQIAILVAQKNAATSSKQFIETLAKNRGFKIRMFTDKEDALDWLKGY